GIAQGGRRTADQHRAGDAIQVDAGVIGGDRVALGREAGIEVRGVNPVAVWRGDRVAGRGGAANLHVAADDAQVDAGASGVDLVALDRDGADVGRVDAVAAVRGDPVALAGRAADPDVAADGAQADAGPEAADPVPGHGGRRGAAHAHAGE